MPKFRLSDIELDEISLVRSGDNHGAKVVIAKAATAEDVDDDEVVDMPENDGKFPQADANYRETGEGYSGISCGNCVFFNRPDTDMLSVDGEVGTCDIVDGSISSKMVCDIFMKMPPWEVKADIGKVKSSVYPGLDRSPKKNWVDQAGGLPSYIERIAKHLHYERGMTIGQAIATAVNRVKKWAAGGKNVNADTRAKAAKAVAEWEAKKAKSKVKKEKPMAKGRVKKETTPPTDEETTEIEEEEGDKSEAQQSDEGSLESDDSDEEEEEVPDEEINKSDLPSEVVAYIDALESRLEAELSKSAKDDDDPMKVALSKADPAIRAVIEKQQEEIKEAKEIAKAERDERLRREYLAKAESLRMISESPDELGTLLRKLNDKAPEEAAQIEKLLGAANTQIAKGNLFTEFGVGGAETTISKSVEGRAEALMKADPDLTREMAIAKVYESDPDLYREYLKEA